jgi:hypothetical protein
LTADAVIQVAQDCTSPDTGIMDFSGAKILIGFLIIGIGYFMFNSPKVLKLQKQFQKHLHTRLQEERE